ncbi:MAG: prenyltransferase [Candidatus Micrarchaeia archaeon]
MLKYYVLELLDPNFVITPVSSLVGIAFAATYTRISIWLLVLLLIGLALANMAVNTFNAYTDYATGLDKEVPLTKFSGGTVKSVYLRKGLINEKEALWLAIFVFALAVSIGVYFVLRVPALLPIVALGAVVIVVYTTFLLKIPYAAEPMLIIVYTLVPIGAFVALTGKLAEVQSLVFSSIPIGILVSMVLLLNEVPDAPFDRKYGRKSLAVMLSDPKRIANTYLLLQAFGYAALIAGVLAKLLKPLALLPMLAIPLMLAAYKGTLHFESSEKFEKYMGYNVAFFFLFVILLSVGIFLNGVL